MPEAVLFEYANLGVQVFVDDEGTGTFSELNKPSIGTALSLAGLHAKTKFTVRREMIIIFFM